MPRRRDIKDSKCLARRITAVLPAQTKAASKAEPRKVRYRVLVAFAFVAASAFFADQLAKYFVVENLPVGKPVAVIGELLQFTFVRNPGAAFSMFSGTTWVFAIIATAVAVFIILFAHRIKSYSWGILFGLLLGGNLGNLADRLFREPGFGVGHVVDFIHVFGFPAIFNVADICIVSSMGLFIILTVRGIGLDGHKLAKSGEQAAASSPADSSPADKGVV
jgi:signal peptidase II